MISLPIRLVVPLWRYQHLPQVWVFCPDVHYISHEDNSIPKQACIVNNTCTTHTHLIHGCTDTLLVSKVKTGTFTQVQACNLDKQNLSSWWSLTVENACSQLS